MYSKGNECVLPNLIEKIGKKIYILLMLDLIKLKLVNVFNFFFSKYR